MRVFLCHSSKDKPLVYELAKVLVRNQVRPYLDVWEFRGGESLAERIAAAIVTESDYLIAVISRNSINSAWVRQELRYAVAREVEHGKTFVIPVLVEDCPVPDILKGKLYIQYVPGDAEAERKLIVALGLENALPREMQYLGYLAQWERNRVLPEDEFFTIFDQQLGHLADETGSKEFVFRALVRNFSPEKRWYVNLFTEDEFVRLATQVFTDRGLDDSQRHRDKTDRESIVRLVHLAAMEWRSWRLATWLSDVLRDERRPAVRNAAVESVLRLARDLSPPHTEEDREQARRLALHLISTAEIVPQVVAAERYRRSQLEKLFTAIGIFALESPQVASRVRALVGSEMGLYPLYALTFWSDADSRALLLNALENAGSPEEASWLAKLASGQITGRFVEAALPVLEAMPRPDWTDSMNKRIRAAASVLQMRIDAQQRRGMSG
jgi:hypothetical protein